MNIPNRQEYLKHQAQTGQKIIGVLPALYPRELLWAFDILPAEMWDPPGEILQANAHLQATICPVVKHDLELILKNPQEVNAGYLFPHTCDSLQNLATQVKDLIGTPLPVYTFYNPKGYFNRATRNFYLDMLKDFQAALETEHGSLDQDAFLTACKSSFTLDKRWLEIQTARQSDLLNLSNLEYFQLIRAGEYLKPEDYLQLLKQVEIMETPVHENNKRLMLSGILPPNDATLSFLDEFDVTIVAEDLLSGSRRIPTTRLDAPKDPYEYLNDRYFLLPPCSTRMSSLEERVHYLNRIISRHHIQGVLFHVVKFCEPELFDHRFLTKTFKQAGLALLSLETELQPGLSGQEKTRIEAFIEMLNDEVLE